MATRGRPKVSEEHKQTVKQLRLARERDARARHRAFEKQTTLDVDGRSQLEVCSYCGGRNMSRHLHKTGMCVECGKLHCRWQKAKRLGIESELRILKPVILARIEKAKSVDKWAAQQSENFYNAVKNTEVISMKQVTSKVCKQCGRELSIDEFRKYKARGRGVYQTTQGRNTLCKGCESISNRAAALLRKSEEQRTDTDHTNLELLYVHYKVLADKGLPPVTAAARRILYGEDACGAKPTRSFRDLLESVSGYSAEESAIDKHCRLVRTRGYASFDEADAVHKQLIDELKDDYRFEEIDNLMDEWYMED